MENVASKNQKNVPGFDEIVFDRRNKEYGAYVLRRQYRRNVIISLFLGLILMAVLVLIPFLNARAAVPDVKTENEKIVVITIDKPLEKVIVPEKQPQPKDEIKVDKYIPPEVVDSVSDKDLGLMTAEEAWEKIKNDTVLELPVEIKTEIEEPVKEQEPFIIVQEMPEYPGGIEALLKYVMSNVVYPEICRENGIQGKVIVKFCVTSKGGVSMISILKGVDPELDKEVMRVVETLPAFRPGKQSGKPVPVWFMLPVLFRLDNK